MPVATRDVPPPGPNPPPPFAPGLNPVEPLRDFAGDQRPGSPMPHDAAGDGTPDPADPSRFRLRNENPQGPHDLDARLTDGDRVLFEAADPPRPKKRERTTLPG